MLVKCKYDMGATSSLSGNVIQPELGVTGCCSGQALDWEMSNLGSSLDFLYDVEWVMSLIVLLLVLSQPRRAKLTLLGGWGSHPMGLGACNTTKWSAWGRTVPGGVEIYSTTEN